MFNGSALFSKAVQGFQAPISAPYSKWGGGPEVVRLGGGYPDPDYYPYHLAGDLAKEVLEKDYVRILSYGNVEGHPELRQWIIDQAAKDGIKAGLENVIMVDGSTETMSLVSRLLINPGDEMVIEEPTYSGAVSVFKMAGANVNQVAMDDDGILLDVLDKLATEKAAAGKPIKFVYIMPNFHNPRGTSMSEERREGLVKLAQKHSFYILEDDAYVEFQYEGKRKKFIKYYDTEGHVIYTSTFSKTFAPGLRLAWILADAQLIKGLALIKGSSNMHPSALSQAITTEYCRRGYIWDHVKESNELYKHRRDNMLNALEKYMPEWVTWTHPLGGYFLWVTMDPKKIDGLELLKAVNTRVLYRPGDTFYMEQGKGLNQFRLCFTMEKEDKVQNGIKILGEEMRRLEKK